jgi:voltage-gated potassium channel
VPVDHCQTALGRRHGALVLAARTGGHLVVNPSWDTELAAGAVLYYVSPRPLTAEEIAESLR